MSLDLMNRIWWRDDLPTTEKFVALALADWADDDEHTCWPAIETIALKCSLSDRTVQTCIARLEARGILKKLVRKNRSHVFMFVIAALPHVEKPKRSKAISPMRDLGFTGEGDSPDLFSTGENDGSGGVKSTTSTGEGVSPRLTIDTSQEPSFDSGNLPLPAAPSEDEIIDKVTATWNDLAKKHPGIQACRLPLDDARKDAIRRRSKRTEQGQSVHDLWRDFFAHIEASPWLQGRIAPSKGHTASFKLSMTWALKSANFNEIMEGKYGQSANDRATLTADGRAMGTAEQATHLAVARRRAARERGG